MNPRSKVAGFLAIVFLTTGGAVRGDFKYSSTARITGGVMAGMMKALGTFSKEANQPIVSTTYLKGNRLRTEDSTHGTAKIVDLDGRRIIEIDAKKQTYSVITFDEMRAAMERAQAQMDEKMKEMKAKNVNVQLTPKFTINPTGRSRTLLGQPAQEVNIKVDMEMQAQDPQHPQTQTGSFTMTSDSWIAPGVTGYGDVHRIYVKMAQEMNWTPNIAFGGDPRMAKALVELQKGGNVPVGLPLLQTMSFGVGGMPQGASGQTMPAQSSGQSSGQASGQASPQGSVTQQAAQAAVAHVLRGFGGFGKKKNPDQTQQTPAASSTGQPAAQPGQEQAAAGSGSLMDMTVEVTSFSDESLDGSLFEVPASYQRVQANPDQIIGARKR